MKKIALLFIALSFLSLKKKEVAAVQQSKSILYADLICLGKMSSIDSTGFWIAVEKEVANETPNKKLLATKKLFVSYKNSKNNYRGTQMPLKDASYIFTLKYDATTKKIIPFYYAVGVIVDTKESIGCYAVGHSKYEKVSIENFIKGIDLLRKCYPKSGLYGSELIKSKVTAKELDAAKKSNVAAKLWIEEIEQMNDYYTKMRK
ncbi:hypothetical protein OX283_001575 [Flavobacterium sp. SUN052]|uniref:hypothetical protein n=1 Tax=Flavobacterium sp. SUN052 TaxID=3002441 RepID=UPI00237EC8B7|nr:hypothetical protein [Flavobacterium sp. SUN052]MEC4003332.1 hypothetical protein [Flavobacterium sp. SUN052]